MPEFTLHANIAYYKELLVGEILERSLWSVAFRPKKKPSWRTGKLKIQKRERQSSRSGRVGSHFWFRLVADPVENSVVATQIAVVQSDPVGTNW